MMGLPRSVNSRRRRTRAARRQISNDRELGERRRARLKCARCGETKSMRDEIAQCFGTNGISKQHIRQMTTRQWFVTQITQFVRSSFPDPARICWDGTTPSTPPRWRSTAASASDLDLFERRDGSRASLQARPVYTTLLVRTPTHSLETHRSFASSTVYSERPWAVPFGSRIAEPRHWLAFLLMF